MSINQVIFIQVTDAKMRGYLRFLFMNIFLYIILFWLYIFRGMSCGLPAKPLWSTGRSIDLPFGQPWPKQMCVCISIPYHSCWLSDRTSVSDAPDGQHLCSAHNTDLEKTKTNCYCSFWETYHAHITIEKTNSNSSGVK